MADNATTRESFGEVLSRFLENIQRLLELSVFVSLPQSEEAVRDAIADWKLYFQAQDKVALAFMIKHGLIGVERHFTDEQLWLLIRWTLERGNDEPNRRLPEFFHVEQIEEMVKSWCDVPYLLSRKQICADAVEAYRLGLYSLVIPALLPLAEGLAYEVVPGDPQKTHTVKMAAQAQINDPSTKDDFAEATLRILEDSYYARADFGHAAPPEVFNRHRILHGRIADYGTAANSIRAFLLIDTVADIWRRLCSDEKGEAAKVGK